MTIPCYYKRSYICWGARDEGGGFKGEIKPEDFDKLIANGTVEVVDGKPLVKNEKGEFNPKTSDYWADTRSHYVLVVDGNDIGQAIISLSSASIKCIQRCCSHQRSRKKVSVGGVMKTPPTFANMVKMTTVGLSNDKGTWSGAKFELDGMVTDPNIYAEAKGFYARVMKGEVKVDHSKNASAAADDSVSGEAVKADEFLFITHLASTAKPGFLWKQIMGSDPTPTIVAI